jgi:hypothetical protein
MGSKVTGKWAKHGPCLAEVTILRQLIGTPAVRDVASNSRLPWQRCHFFLGSIHSLFKIPLPQRAHTVAAYPAFRYPHAPSRATCEVGCEEA